MSEATVSNRSLSQMLEEQRRIFNSPEARKNQRLVFSSDAPIFVLRDKYRNLISNEEELNAKFTNNDVKMAFVDAVEVFLQDLDDLFNGNYSSNSDYNDFHGHDYDDNDDYDDDYDDNDDN